MRHASDRFLPMLAGRTARRVHCLKPSLTDWQPQHHRRIALASQPIRLTRGGGKRNQTTRRPPRTTGGSAARGRCRFSAWGLHDAWAAVLAGVHLMDGDRLTVCPGDEAASPGGAWWVVPGPSWGLDCTCRLRRSTEHRRRHVRHLRMGIGRVILQTTGGRNHFWESSLDQLLNKVKSMRFVQGDLLTRPQFSPPLWNPPFPCQMLTEMDGMNAKKTVR
jgi:hypothetical protein